MLTAVVTVDTAATPPPGMHRTLRKPQAASRKPVNFYILTVPIAPSRRCRGAARTVALELLP